MNYEQIKENIKIAGFMPHLGMKITELSDGHCTGEMPLNEITCNPYGIVHGGCIYSLADAISGSAALTKSDKVVTLDSSISFLSGAVNDGKLIATAHEIRHGGKIAVYNVEVSTSSGFLIATATFTFYIMD